MFTKVIEEMQSIEIWQPGNTVDPFHPYCHLAGFYLKLSLVVTNLPQGTLLRYKAMEVAGDRKEDSFVEGNYPENLTK